MERIVIFKIKLCSGLCGKYCKPASPYIKEALNTYSGESFVSERNKLKALLQDLDSVVLLPFDKTGGDVFPFAKEGQFVAILEDEQSAGVIGVADSLEELLQTLEDFEDSL